MHGNRTGDASGVLGVCFDWDTEAKKILTACLPTDRDGTVIEGSASFYTNAQGEIIETSDTERFSIGKRIVLTKEMIVAPPGTTVSYIAEIDGRRYIVGSSKTKGYREYPGLGWRAFVIRPLF